MDWYFDFISPFAYLQLESFHQLGADIQINYQPILLAGLLHHWGHKGPAEIPKKRTFTYKHCIWLAEQAGIPLKCPPAHPFNPLNLLRLSQALGNKPEVVRAIFHYIWREGHDPNDPEGLGKLAHQLGCDDPITQISDPVVKTALRSQTEAAAARGIFGVPTFYVDEQLFWGYDSTLMLADYLKHHEKFSTGEYGRMETLPQTAKRV